MPTNIESHDEACHESLKSWPLAWEVNEYGDTQVHQKLFRQEEAAAGGEAAAGEDTS